MLKNNQKIAFFLPSLRGGGAERMLINLANEFSSIGIKTSLILCQKKGEYINKVNKDVEVVDLKKNRILACLFPLAQYLRRQKPDALISSVDHANTVAVMAKMLAYSRTRVIIRVANTVSVLMKNENFIKRWLMFFSFLFFYRFANVVVANSKGAADDLAKTVKISRERVKVIYNPTVTPEIVLESKKKSDHNWLDNKNTLVILGVGRLSKQKNFSTLIKAFLKIRKLKKSKLIILGEGDEREKLQELIKNSGLEDDVDMPGFVKNPYAFMAKADIYVLSSRWEGLPNTLIEAMACGTPVVSTDCPSGPAEILEDGKYGKLVPVGDVEAMAQAILETLDNPIAPEILQERASYFSIERAVEKYLEIINL